MPYIEIEQRHDDWFKAQGLDTQAIANNLLAECIAGASAAEKREAAEAKADADREKAREERRDKGWPDVEGKQPDHIPPPEPKKPAKKKRPKK